MRALRRAERIRERLQWEPGIGNPPGEKPKGMTWRRYRELVDEHERLAGRVFGCWTADIERRMGRVSG